LCRRAEATGADSLWVVDHLYWPRPVGEAFTTLAVAALTTTRPLLGTCVLQLPLRPSSVVAKQATALQLLSGGRFVLGLGVGIHEPEYRRAGIDYHRRGQLMDEGVAGLRQAWAGPDGGSAASAATYWSGARKRGTQPSPTAAARRRAASLEPPNHSGTGADAGSWT
jgi:alkanesulfonate monooxygenase SsuD/methylene tetrahydromethanopterin reductase-like flavin-dependent oxidoreductase (luciferase family)